MKLTVVVYAQNAEQNSLSATLKSLKNSTLKDYEALILDDGSKESYLDLAKKYNASYVKTEKRGALASRLYALMIAKGEYITFLNAGQEVTFNYYAPMLELASAMGLDLMCGDVAYSYNGVKFTCNENALQCVSLANKIYRVSALKLAKRDIENDNVIMHTPSVCTESIITLYASKHMKNVNTIKSGYVFLTLDDEKIDVVQCAKEIKALVPSKSDLYARALCYIAKAQKEKSKLAQIEQIFENGKIKPISKKEATQYRKIELLGDNFADIEKALKKIYDTSVDVMVIYDMGNEYEKSTLDYIQSRKAKSDDKPLTLMVPKRICKAKAKIAPEAILAKNLLK